MNGANQHGTWLPDDGIIDEIAIDRVCRDRQYARLTRPEALIAVDRLTAHCVSAPEIAQLLRCGERTVERLRAEVSPLVAA